MPSAFVANLEKARRNRDLSVFDIHSIDALNQSDIELVLELAKLFHKVGNAKLPLLTNVSIINAFYENSTRTRLSFELAGKELDANTAHISALESSVKKGESFVDTAATLSALGAKILVIRVAQAGVPEFLAQHTAASIVNAGDGWHEHPSQGLLDAKTLMDELGTLKGKTIVVVGDILHSRVFGSLVRIVPRLGGKIRICCPETFLPVGIEQFHVEKESNIEKALQNADAVYALRVQEERGATGDIPNLPDYARAFCITPERFAKASKKAILLHAGPVIRNIDISASLLTHERCMVTKQVTNGLAVRKAILWLLGDRRDGRTKSFSAL